VSLLQLLPGRMSGLGPSLIEEQVLPDQEVSRRGLVAPLTREDELGF
jgi:hypothetical protein